jgi:hypothetical protein
MIRVDLSGDERISLTKSDILLMGWELHDNGDIDCWTSVPVEHPGLIVGEQLIMELENAVLVGEIIIADDYGLLAKLYPIVEYGGMMRHIELDDSFNAKLVPDIIDLSR